MRRGVGLLVALSLIALGPIPARALSQFDIELMLVWTGHLAIPAGEASSTERRAAIQAHQRATGAQPTGELSGSDLATLQDRSRHLQAKAGFRDVLDAPTGVRIGLPLGLLLDDAKRTKRGSEWRDQDANVIAQTMLIPVSEASLETFYKNLRALPGRRFIEPKPRPEIGPRDERFTLAGDFGTRKFYIHARSDGREIRALQFSFAEEKAEVFDRIALAMISTFDPFPAGGGPPAAGPRVAGFPPATHETDPRTQVSEFKQERLNEKRAAQASGKSGMLRRVALVLGNDAYGHAGRLKNAVNDADDISQILTRLGFTVIKGTDRSKRETEELLQGFVDRLDRSDVALFYYSGHGLQINGRNYVVPVDAKIEKERDVAFQAISVDFILEQMENAAPTNLVFLDACRDNPFARSLSTTVARSLYGRPVEVMRGLAQVTPGRGTFIAFSTAPNKVASDGGGRNSPFTAALKRYITTPDVSVSDVMISVRNDVHKETNERQLPWDQSALMGPFYFVTTQTAGRQ
jgi:hypothetical protein